MGARACAARDQSRPAGDYHARACAWLGVGDTAHRQIATNQPATNPLGQYNGHGICYRIWHVLGTLVSPAAHGSPTPHRGARHGTRVRNHARITNVAPQVFGTTLRGSVPPAAPLAAFTTVVCEKHSPRRAASVRTKIEATHSGYSRSTLHQRPCPGKRHRQCERASHLHRPSAAHPSHS